jgi:hypothetical protein
MPSRVQQLILGLGVDKQADIATAGTLFYRWRKIDTAITTPKPIFENDAPEIGKGHEFITQTYPSYFDVANRIEKYASAEFLTWAFGFALGNVTVTGSAAPYVYTIVPIDPGTALELPYFSIAEQIAEGGGSAIDNLYVGCAIEDVTYTFNYGPGRASSKCTVNWMGSGLLTSPSAVTIPALIPETNILSAGMSLVVNGVNYVSTKRILSGSVSWKNNLMGNAGFYPGSGLQNGLQVRGRMEIGPRVPSFQFTVRLLHGSVEYTNLVSQATGAAVLTVPHDANNTVTFTFPKLALQMVENTEADGIVAVTVTGAPEFDTVTGTVMSITSKCTLAGIAQAAA